MEPAENREDTDFPPEKRLEAPNTRLIDAGISTIPDMDTLRECVAYENAHQNRTQILRRLEVESRRAAWERGVDSVLNQHSTSRTQIVG